MYESDSGMIIGLARRMNQNRWSEFRNVVMNRNSTKEKIASRV
jgi:hypothetical protein